MVERNALFSATRCFENLLKEAEDLLADLTAVGTVLMNKKFADDSREKTRLAGVNIYGSKVAAMIGWVEELTALDAKNYFIFYSEVREQPNTNKTYN